MYLKIHKFFVLTFIFALLMSLFPIRIFADEELPESKVIITEVKLGGGRYIDFQDVSIHEKDFVTLYNQSDEEINFAGWRLEYAKPGFNPIGCNNISWDNIVYLAGILPPGSVSLPISISLTDSIGGSLRIIDGSNLVHDVVGWDKTESSAPCLDNQENRRPAQWPGAGESLQRHLDCVTGLPVDTNDNSADFVLSENPKPGELPRPTVECPHPENDGGKGGGAGDTNQNSCAGVIITEVLPNPSGPDSGKEFIELYNPTSHTISLKGCQLETTANSKTYIFGHVSRPPKQYKALYDDVTGLTLNNSSGGSVYLIDTDNSEQEVEYLANLEDDVAWAIDIGSDTWSITYSPTPGAKNEIVEVKPPKSCSAGQFRNLETNRCNKVVIKAGLGACPAGKFRNPETNRCKSILASDSRLKSCGPGQFRNPDTNRCKSSGSGKSLVPCKPNQERNPETNRCRKMSDSEGNANKIKDVLSVTNTQNYKSWAVAGLSFTGASVYAIWEWRSEILEKFLSLKSKLPVK